MAVLFMFRRKEGAAHGSKERRSRRARNHSITKSFVSTEICHTEPRDGNRRKEAFDAWQMLWE